MDMSSGNKHLAVKLNKFADSSELSWRGRVGRVVIPFLVTPSMLEQVKQHPGGRTFDLFWTDVRPTKHDMLISTLSSYGLSS
jgi:hypothetical protein